MGCLVQRMLRCTGTGAAGAGVASFASTNAATCRVLAKAADFGIDEASLGGVAELALPIADAACAGGVEAVPAGHLTDSATSNNSQLLSGSMLESSAD